MRNRKTLELNIKTAHTDKDRALAYYNLALFHDNNSREQEAISNYEKALRLGLNKKKKAEALAWLASSLYKTGKAKEALMRLAISLGITKDNSLRRFLYQLKQRVEKDPNRYKH